MGTILHIALIVIYVILMFASVIVSWTLRAELSGEELRNLVFSTKGLTERQKKLWRNSYVLLVASLVALVGIVFTGTQ